MLLMMQGKLNSRRMGKGQCCLLMRSIVLTSLNRILSCPSLKMVVLFLWVPPPRTLHFT
uniref:Uncharacterized protein n=1 Tax=Rhizophora mucronata TaxID=61149 RepID=A0A2P2JJK4_RHIMU